MVLYFSSTENCKHIAKRLAKAFGGDAISIVDTKEIHIQKGEKLGFVFPTYFWRLPSVVDDYMKKLQITAEDESPYIYFIATYGTTCGKTGTFMKRHIKSKGFALSASYSIKTVDDYTVLFDLSDKSKVDSALAREKTQLEEIITQITANTKGCKMKNTLPMIAVMGSNVFYSRARRTKHLHVSGDCISCGKCEKECPVSAIKLQNGKPLWVKDKCAMCLHCLHSCPKFAIQYDDKTQNHGQYMHP